MAGEISSATAPSDAKRMAPIKMVRDKFLSCLMLSGANRDRYTALKTNLHNQYGYGKDLYPKSPDQCLTLLNRCSDAPTRSPRHKEPKPAPIKQEEEALVFAQGTSDRSGAQKHKDKNNGSRASSSVSSSPSKHRVTNVRCKTCNKLGHTSSMYPDSKPPAQIHAMLAEADDASVASDEESDEESVIILTQAHTSLGAVCTSTQKSVSVCSETSPVGANPAYLLTQDVPGPAIDTDLVLLNSQLTVDLFSNPAHVHNICPTRNPIQVHCNSGTMSTTTEADFGDTPVYFNSRGIEYVLSLYRLGRKFRVTYNSNDRNGVFQVHTKHGVVEFKPTPKALHALNLKDNPDAAFLLVNDAEVQMPRVTPTKPYVATVRTNFEGFSRKQVEGAMAARCLMGMVATPSPRDFEGMVRLNMLKDCPITNDDITNANKIFGTDLATLRGKTVRRRPKRVITDYVNIPRLLVEANQRVTLAADVMFVNSVPFLVSVSRNINLISI